MPSLEHDTVSRRYRVRFRFAGREYKRSLRTTHRRVAEASLGQVEETLRLLEMGLAELPENVDEGTLITSGARVRKEKAARSRIETVDDLFRIYQAELTAEAKEERTLAGERLHFTHLRRHLKPRTRLAAIKANTIQKYVELRSQDEYRGRFISPVTIKKELTTLRLVWNWANRQEYVQSPPPVKHVIYPKRDENTPFQTKGEIDRILSRGNVPPATEAALWRSLYLMRTEVDNLLKGVAKAPTPAFVYVMLARGYREKVIGIGTDR